MKPSSQPVNRACSHWLLSGVLLLLSAVCVADPSERQQRLTPLEQPSAAPPFHLPGLDGGVRQLADFRGEVLIVNFWASWCAPCRVELPSMNRAAAALQGDGVAMVAINVFEEREAVAAFVADFPIDFPVLLDSQGEVSRHWQVKGLPTTFVIDRRGQIVYRAIGERDWDDAALLRQVRDLAHRGILPDAVPLEAGAEAPSGDPSDGGYTTNCRTMISDVAANY